MSGDDPEVGPEPQESVPIEDTGHGWESETLERAYKELGEDLRVMGQAVMKRLLFVATMCLLVAGGMLHTWYQTQLNNQTLARHQEALEMLVENQALMSESIRDIAMRQEQLDDKIDRMEELLGRVEFQQLREKTEARGVDSPAPLRR